jgi:hypothetical protein
MVIDDSICTSGNFEFQVDKQPLASTICVISAIHSGDDIRNLAVRVKDRYSEPERGE